MKTLITLSLLVFCTLASSAKNSSVWKEFEEEIISDASWIMVDQDKADLYFPPQSFTFNQSQEQSIKPAQKREYSAIESFRMNSVLLLAIYRYPALSSAFYYPPKTD